MVLVFPISARHFLSASSLFPSLPEAVYPSLYSLREASAPKRVRTPTLLRSCSFNPARFYFVRNQTLDGLM